MEKNQIINGVREGYWEWCYNNFNLWLKGNYIGGERVGLWNEYDFNGKLCWRQYYLVD